VDKPVSRAVGPLGLSREVLVRLFTTFHYELRRHYEELRHQRDPQDPDCLRYRVWLGSGDRWHVFSFWVNDTRAKGFIFIETVDHESGPLQ
jgi:hypothetical protein